MHDVGTCQLLYAIKVKITLDKRGSQRNATITGGLQDNCLAPLCVPALLLYDPFILEPHIVIFVVQREEDVYLLDSIPGVLFCRQVQSSLLRISHSLAVRGLNSEVDSKDGCRIIGFSFVWPDVASLCSSCHVETLFDAMAVLLFGFIFVYRSWRV